MALRLVTINLWKLHEAGMYETVCFLDSDERTHVYEKDNIIRFKYSGRYHGHRIKI